MKNFIKLFLLSIIALCVIGCANPANNSNDDDENKPVDTTELKMALYNKIIGTWELAEEEGDPDSGYETIVFSSDSITFNGKKYSFDISTDFLLEEEIAEEKRMNSIAYINVDGLTFIDFDTSLSNVDSLELGKVFYFELDNEWTALPDYFIKVSGGNSESGGGENLDFSVVGDWSYTIAAGNTKTTFSIEDDGTFSFTKNSDVTNGTYSLSGNKITFKFTKDVVKTEDTFTISGSEDEITLTLVESKTVTNGQPQTGTAFSNMLLAFYTSTDTTISLSK